MTQAKKKTSARVAKIAGKYAAMDNNELFVEAGVFKAGDDEWTRFCFNVRALAGSVLSQTESKTKVKRK